jgi:hypothetical protein
MLDVRSGALAGERVAFVLEAGSQLYRSVDSPVLLGPEGSDHSFTSSYDRPFKRWLPVPSDQVSRDGSQYFYIAPHSLPGGDRFPVDYLFHVVDVRTGHERTITLHAQSVLGPAYHPIYFAREGIYVAEFGYEGPGPMGLWLLDLTTGKLDKVFDGDAVGAIGGGAAWLAHGNGDDPHAYISPYDGTVTPNEVLRRDLSSGVTVSWFYRPGEFITMLGLDFDHHPVVGVYRAASRGEDVWLVSAARAGVRVGAFSALTGVSADSYGVWLGSDRGIYLSRRASGLVQVSNVAGTPAGTCS